MRPRRGLALVLLLAMLLMTLPATPVYAESIWQTLARANSLEQAGQIDQAMPLWLTLAQAFGERGEHTNAAIHWKKLGKAYDDRNLRKEAIHAYEQENYYWELAGYDWGKADMLRADQLRSSLQLFVAQLAAKLSRPLAKHEPANGALIGFYSEQDRSVGNLFYKAEQAYGHPMAAALIYFTYGKSDIDIYLARAKEAGVGLQIAFQPLNGLDVVKDDAYLRSFARKLKESGLPIFLRFAGEMNGDWTPWAAEPQRYIEKFRIVSKVMKEEAPNVAMLWAPGYVPDNYMPYYPGDEWVDWVGVSMYLDYYNNGNANEPTDRASLLDMLKQITERFGDRKPIMIAEWGVANRDYTKRENHDAWAIANLERLLAGLPRKYPQVKGLFYFMVDQGKDPHAVSVWSNYEFSTKPAIMSAYQKAVAEPYFLTRMGQTAPTAYRELAVVGDRLEPGTQELSAVVKLYDPIVSRVEYLVDGRVIGSATKAPYTLKHDFAPYDGSRVTVTVRAYNSQGQVEEESRFPIAVGLSDLAGHWAKEQIQSLVARKVVGGYPDGTFRPEEPISREAFFKLLAGAIGATESGLVNLPDLPATKWSYPAASALVARGILKPEEYPGRLLQPEEPITREEMAVLIARAAGLAPAGVPAVTDREQIRAAWRPLIGAALEAKLFTGFADQTFRPQAGAKRAEAAVVILRLLTR